MIRYGIYEVKIPGETYKWEPDTVTLGEQLMLERETGTSYNQWVRDISYERAEAWQILIWFLRRREGRQEDRFSVDFSIRDADLVQIEKAVEDEPDPEAPAGSEPATSEQP